MGRGRGASYRPPPFYQPEDRAQPRLRDDENIGQSQRQVDSWRSYGNGKGRLNAAINSTFSPPKPYLNPAAPTFDPSRYGHPTQFRPQYTPYEPLRVSNGLQEQQIMNDYLRSQNEIPDMRNQVQISQGYMPSSDLPRMHHRYPLRSHLQQTDSSNIPIASVEPPTATKPSGARPGLERLRQANLRSTPNRPVVSPPAPKATKAYLEQAGAPSRKKDTTQPLLIILDLNGTLINKPDRRNPRSFNIRPGANDLFEYLFDNHTVMIYTSSHPKNAASVVEQLFTKPQREKISAVWARDKLELNQVQYWEKVQVYKKLDRIWNDHSIQAAYPNKGQWDQTNTVLVDDSHLKALSQPHNLLQVPEYTGIPTHQASKKVTKKHELQQEQILKSLVVKLEELKWQTDVSQLIREWQTGEAEIPKLPKSGLLFDESLGQKRLEERQTETQIAMSSSPDSDGGVKIPRLNEDSNLVLEPDVRDDNLSVDGEQEMVAKITNLPVRGGRKRSESSIPMSIFADLLGAGAKGKVNRGKKPRKPRKP